MFCFVVACVAQKLPRAYIDLNSKFACWINVCRIYCIGKSSWRTFHFGFRRTVFRVNENVICCKCIIGYQINLILFIRLNWSIWIAQIRKERGEYKIPCGIKRKKNKQTNQTKYFLSNSMANLSVTQDTNSHANACIVTTHGNIEKKNRIDFKHDALNFIASN